MAASTLSRPSITDDTGNGTSGTILNAAFFTSIFDAIDALFSATTGLTLNQAGGDGSILIMQSSDVAHGMTAIRATDTYGDCGKIVDSTGGLQISGFSSGSVGTRLFGAHTTDDTAKSTAAIGVIDIYGALKSGTTVGALGANANLVVIRNNASAKFIFDAEGDSHEDGTGWTAYDDHDDLALAEALDRTLDPQLRARDLLREDAADFLASHRAWLQRARVVTFNEGGAPFINTSRLAMLHNGAIRQLGARVLALQARVDRLLPEVA